METLPLFKLTINEEETAIQEVNAVALVDVPAIGQPFFAFAKHLFVEPAPGESEADFMPRCIEYVMNEGKDNEQAVAMCSSMWRERQSFESYSDYPKAASENAKIALRWAEENGWGGDEGIEWAQRKLQQIDKEKQFRFAVVKEDERVIIGPAMIPDLPIYRSDSSGEYYVYFDKKTIETIALKFYAKGFQQNANIMHEKSIEGVTFFMSWIADESKGIPKMKQFENLPDGTWFLGAKVNNEDTWAKVKDGTFKGFSVEGMFDMTEIKMKMNEEQIINRLRELLKDF